MNTSWWCAVFNIWNIVKWSLKICFTCVWGIVNYESFKVLEQVQSRSTNQVGLDFYVPRDEKGFWPACLNRLISGLSILSAKNLSSCDKIKRQVLCFYSKPFPFTENKSFYRNAKQQLQRRVSMNALTRIVFVLRGTHTISSLLASQSINAN